MQLALPALPVLPPLSKINILGAAAAFSNGVKKSKEICDDFGQLKELVLTHNSESDQKYQAENPPPPADAADIKQIAYYGERCAALTYELVLAVGDKCHELNEKRNAS